VALTALGGAMTAFVAKNRCFLVHGQQHYKALFGTPIFRQQFCNLANRRFLGLVNCGAS